MGSASNHLVRESRDRPIKKEILWIHKVLPWQIGHCRAVAKED